MERYLRVILINLLFTLNIFAQIPENNQLFVYPQSLAIESYNSIGFSNMNLCTISDVSSANPASLYQFENISVGLNYQYLSKMKLYSDISVASAKTFPPVTFGFIYPINNFRLGFAYHQKYNNYLDFGKSEITTVENPEGTGEFYSAYSERLIHSPSLLSNYTISSIFGDDKLSIGLQVFWDFLKTKEKIYKMKSHLEGNSLTWKLGLLYEYRNETYISFVYEKGNRLDGEFETEDEFVEVVDINGRTVEINPNYFMKLPDKMSFGLTVSTTNDLVLSMSISAVFWELVNDIYKNSLDISAGTIYRLNKSVRISLGFYNSDLNREVNGFFYSGLNYNSSFMGVGLNWHINNVDVQFELFDNKLFSPKLSDS